MNRNDFIPDASVHDDAEERRQYLAAQAEHYRQAAEAARMNAMVSAGGSVAGAMGSVATIFAALLALAAIFG